MVIIVDWGPPLSRFTTGRKRIQSGGREKRRWEGGAHGLIKQGELIFLQRSGHITTSSPSSPEQESTPGGPVNSVPFSLVWNET